MSYYQLPQWAQYSEDVLLSLARPISVVGNATPKRNWGAVIDRYASVIRLNNFKIDGFETLVGRRTDVRCTKAAPDIEHRDSHVELSPYTASALFWLPEFNAANARPLLTAYADIRFTRGSYPTTGFALVHLLELLEVPADIFGFDGFRTKHYWERENHRHNHQSPEFDALLSCSHMAVYGDVNNGDRDFAADAQKLAATADASWHWMKEQGYLDLSGQRVLDIGGLSKNALAELEVRGNRVVSIALWPRHRVQSAEPDATGGVQNLAFLEPHFDCCVSFGLLDALQPNDIRIFVRQASRLSPRLLLTVRAQDVSCQPPALGAHDDAVQPLAWWIAQFSPHYDTTVRPCAPVGYWMLHCRRRGQKRSIENTAATTRCEVATTNCHIRSDYVSRPHAAPAHYAGIDDGAVGKPDVCGLLCDLARLTGCRRILDLGCGRARRLAALHLEFEILGMDAGASLDRCRAEYPFGTWSEVDFEQPQLASWDRRSYADTAIICADLIQRLVDPTGLMALLRDLLVTAPFALLTTPERDLMHGPDHHGPPPNPFHVREWNMSELRRYAQANALDVAFAGLTASLYCSFPLETSLLLLCGRSMRAEHRQAMILACEVLRGYDALARERDMLMRERDAAQGEADELSGAAARQRLNFQRTLIRRLMAQIRRARIGSVVVIGAGELGRFAADSLIRAGVRVVGFGDDVAQRWGSVSGDLRVVSVYNSLSQPADAVVIASAGRERRLCRQVRGIIAELATRPRIFSVTL